MGQAATEEPSSCLLPTCRAGPLSSWLYCPHQRARGPGQKRDKKVEPGPLEAASVLGGSLPAKPDPGPPGSERQKQKQLCPQGPSTHLALE